MPQKEKAPGARPMVVSRHGRYRFQTGMVTASLLQRGLSMADAFAVSAALRDAVEGLAELTTDQLEQRTRAIVRERLGVLLPPETTREAASRAASRTAGGAGGGSQAAQNPAALQPALEPSASGRLGHPPAADLPDAAATFNQGLLVRYLITAGLEIQPAIEVARDLRSWAALRAESGAPLGDSQQEAEVVRILRERHGEAAARRYRLTGLIRRASKPVFVLIGGATGTGKSTLATELAFRLGIRLVTSTDMVRETMRTVLSPEVVPGLHDHSFRGVVAGGGLSDPRESVLLGFRQQAAQVAVGIRAVIRRAIRENAGMILEGTHLVPPFEQYFPAGADVISAGFVLAVPEESVHRERFPLRARDQVARDPGTYLEAFQAVRWVHDELLRAAEDSGAVVIGTTEINQTFAGAVEYLSQALPFPELGSATAHTLPALRAAGAGGAGSPRTLMLILDGLADEPNPALGGRTPLQAARTPVLQRLAGSGGQGLMWTGHEESLAPETDEGLLALLGDRARPGGLGRGLLEALGQGLLLPPGAVVFRGNLATIGPDGALADRRAGRIRAGTADLLAGLREVPLQDGLRGHIYPGHEHRVVVMLQGGKLSAQVSDSDPGGEALVQRFLTPQPRADTPEAARTARGLAELLDLARAHLAAQPLNAERVQRGLQPANCVITRGAAAVDDLPRMRHATAHAALVSACPTALGVARALGLQPATSSLMTGNLDTQLDEKFKAAAMLLRERKFVVVHVKGTDIAAHDRRPLEKRDFIEAVDAALGRFLSENNELADGLRVAVSADHGTSSLSGNHLPGPVPLLVAHWNPDAEPADFDERSAQHGVLGLVRAGDLQDLLWGT